jgi:protein CpxP
MKKILSFLVMAAVAVALPINAQNGTQGGERTAGQRGGGQAQRMEQLTKDLDLKADQQTKLKELFKQQGEKTQELRKDTSLTQEQRREKSQALRKEMEPKIKAILTAEQYEKYTKLQQERRNAQGGSRGAGAKPEGQKPQGEGKAK